MDPKEWLLEVAEDHCVVVIAHEDMNWGYHVEGDIGLWFTPGGLNKAFLCLTLLAVPG